jgi:hypothetical protein
MNNPYESPHPDIVKRHKSMLCKISQNLDALNLLLDEAIASADNDIRLSSRNISLFPDIKGVQVDRKMDR